MLGHQQQPHVAGVEGLLDSRMPFLPKANLPVVPDLQDALLLQYMEVRRHTVFPRLVFMAVADEYFQRIKSPIGSERSIADNVMHRGVNNRISIGIQNNSAVIPLCLLFAPLQFDC